MTTIVLNAKILRKTIAVQSKVGVPGQTGAAGPAGADGDDGLSAYQVALANGFVGTEAQWLASLVGAAGPQGIQGVQGPIGIQGPAGEAGATGATGAAGHSPVVIFGSGADADRLTIDGVASGPHLTGPQGAPGTTDHSALTNLSADTHAQYHTDARGDARYSPLGHSHAGAYDPAGTAAAAVSAHTAASDPHPGYLTPAEGNAAYEPINANIQSHIASTANPHGVTAAQAGADPAGTASAAIAAHVAAADPHPTYTTAAEAAAAAPVQSVAGKTGAVALAIADTSGLQTALDGKAATGHSHSGLLPAGGSTGQVLAKASATDYDTSWVTPAADGSGGTFQRGATFVNASGLSLPVNNVPVVIPIACTIAAVTVLTAGGPGSCVIDVWRDLYANYPPTVADSICGSSKPTISGGTKYQDATLTGWTTVIAAGDTIIFNLESVSGFTLVDITLTLEPT